MSNKTIDADILKISSHNSECNTPLSLAFSYTGKSSINNQLPTTNNQKNSHDLQHKTTTITSTTTNKLKTTRVTKQLIHHIGNDIFVSEGRGITFHDLLQGKHACVKTRAKAQFTLTYHRLRGNLCTSSHRRTRPQEHFINQQDAELSDSPYYNNSQHPIPEQFSTNNDPTGVPFRSTPPPFALPPLTIVKSRRIESLDELFDQQQKQTPNQTTKEVDTLDEAFARVAGNRAINGMHNIHLQLSIPEQYTEQIYHELLKHIPVKDRHNKGKVLEFRIVDNYLVKCTFYPKSNNVLIYIPCSDKALPIINEDSADLTTSNFLLFLSAIRQKIADYLYDRRGLIIPPVQSTAWTISEADFNFDVPTTARGFQFATAGGKMQVTKFNNIVMGYYTKRLSDGSKVIRLEQRVYTFDKRRNTTTAITDDSIGHTLIKAVKTARENVLHP